MTDTATPSTNSFSWRRMLLFAGFYRHAIRTQCLIYAAATLVIYLGMIFLPPGTKSFLTTTIGLMTFGGPLVFCRRDNTLLRMAPVTAAERLAFYLLYTFVVIPVGLELWFDLIQGIGTLISPLGDAHAGFRYIIENFSDLNMSASGTALFVAGSWSIAIMVMGAVLFGAICGRNPVLSAILRGAAAYVGALFVIIIYSSCIGAAAAFSSTEEVDGEVINGYLMAHVPVMMAVLGAISLCIFTAMSVRLYRRLR